MRCPNGAPQWVVVCLMVPQTKDSPSKAGDEFVVDQAGREKYRKSSSKKPSYQQESRYVMFAHYQKSVQNRMRLVGGTYRIHRAGFHLPNDSLARSKANRLSCPADTNEAMSMHFGLVLIRD